MHRIVGNDRGGIYLFELGLGLRHCVEGGWGCL